MNSLLFDNLNDILNGVIMTLNTKDGNGLWESVIVIVILFLSFFLSYTGQCESKEFMAVIHVILGALIGTNIEKSRNNREKK